MNITFERRVRGLERARSRQLEHDEDYEVTLDGLTEMAFTAYRLAIADGSADAAQLRSAGAPLRNPDQLRRAPAIIAAPEPL